MSGKSRLSLSALFRIYHRSLGQNWIEFSRLAEERGWFEVGHATYDGIGISSPKDEIDHDKTDTFKPWLPSSHSDVDALSLIYVWGDEDLQRRLRSLCREFKDVFSYELPAAPVKIKSFHLEVDDDKLRVPRNRAPPRSQSRLKQAALFATLETLLQHCQITSVALQSYWYLDQIRRFVCVATIGRNTYDCTPDASWPIPNIVEMQQIGSRKPNIFGSMDLTQGYH